ncbi:heme-dependent oxidative N-demethylase subunit alpha family protein [Aliiroseovarius salicola]|uniref:heme-dependent oxidative N-demethylase subunit alpha family protein n=1 Tax=Aliiroseovarius salicola TaxID=3009082 RepID=UPI002FDE8308
MPIKPGEWLLMDDAYADQMAHRRALIASKGDLVHRISDGAFPAARELLSVTLDDPRSCTRRGIRR